MPTHRTARRTTALIVSVLVALLSALVAVVPASAVESPPQPPDIGNLGAALGGAVVGYDQNYDAAWYRSKIFWQNAQTFTADRTGQIPRVQLRLARYADPTDPWWNYYYTETDLKVHVTTVGADGRPTDNVLATATLTPADVTGTTSSAYVSNGYQFNWHTPTVTFADPASVQTGHKYAIVLRVVEPPAGSTSYASVWYWGHTSPYASNPYNGGSLHYRYGHEWAYADYPEWNGSYTSAWNEYCWEYSWNGSTYICSGTLDGIFGVFIGIAGNTDTTAPQLSLPADRTVEATGPSGATVSYTATADDAVDGSVPVSCTPGSGSTFALGTSTVSCSAADAAGNTAHGSFAVTVRDTTAPTLTAPDTVTVQATGASGAVAHNQNSAAALVDGTVPVSCSTASGSTFAPGDTTVTCTATDAAGNTATKQVTVRVRYGFTGLFAPVDNAAVNAVKAGRAVPVKFNLSGDMGLSIFRTGWPKSVTSSGCTGTEDAIESTVTAGGSSLSYDAATGQYNYVWKTDPVWAGSCRKLSLGFADGTERTAMFRFVR